MGVNSSGCTGGLATARGREARGNLPPPVPAQRLDACTPQPQQAERSRHRRMMVRVGEHTDHRRALKTLDLDIPPLARQHRVTRSGERGRMRHLASGDKGVTGISGQPQSLQQELARYFFKNRTSGTGRCEHRILVPSRTHNVGCQRSGQCTAFHPCEKAPARISSQAGLSRRRNRSHHIVRRHSMTGKFPWKRQTPVVGDSARPDRACIERAEIAAGFCKGDIERVHIVGIPNHVRFGIPIFAFKI